MTDEELSVIAESSEHAEWIIDHHVGVGPDPNRTRCPICEQWWPCDLVGMAALAVLQGRYYRAALKGALSPQRQ